MNLTDIKQRFFGFRNGIVAKAFHDAGYPHKTIFGLQLPQIAAIARETGLNDGLARELWADTGCRESRLLACYIFDPATLSEEEAFQMASQTLTREEADILAWRLLRRLPYAPALLPRLSGYIAEALDRNISD